MNNQRNYRNAETLCRVAPFSYPILTLSWESLIHLCNGRRSMEVEMNMPDVVEQTAFHNRCIEKDALPCVPSRGS